jgi:hypothetical protein
MHVHFGGYVNDTLEKKLQKTLNFSALVGYEACRNEHAIKLRGTERRSNVEHGDEGAPPRDEPGDATRTDKRTAKSRRCYHRVISGLERGGKFRFLTLTSSNQSPDTCQRSWRVLYMRLKRRHLVEGYIKVPEASKNGKQHLHVLFRGEYIAQAMLSEWWQEIHRAKVVDIRQVHKKRGKRHLAAYMAKYLSKENFFRYSWSWNWVWRGFVKDWTKLKRGVRDICEMSDLKFTPALLFLWRLVLKKGRQEGWPILVEQGVVSE